MAVPRALAVAPRSRKERRSFMAIAIAFVGTWLLTTRSHGATFAGVSQPVARAGAKRSSGSSLRGLKAFIKVRDPPKEGARQIVDGPNGPIVVANVGGTYYAVDATCPHLNLPMKKGKIEDGPNGPTITCSFHNSCFSMKSGECERWVTGALGKENEIVAGVMGGIGNEKKGIATYNVVDPEDGYLWVETGEGK
eukprot:TRINITY_DN51705_c0_g1_i1.p1 TRINITY_DN51705_c0_g1~~TRINITY_DN51705_c0_g1_i1.p1  ORF type:complete len:211 (+),score=25.96 TRINITY_DN51705_c0_g1_i1:54-635(+)